MSYPEGLKGKLRVNEPLFRHTTFRIGGKADFFFEPQNLADLKLLLTKAKKDRIPLKVIGAGSNLLVSDRRIKAMVIKLSAPDFKKIVYKNGFLEAGAGVLLSCLVKKACALGLSGIEFLSGMPGTVGGALVMNAGSKDKEIKELVEDILIINYNGDIKRIKKKAIKFSYRNSNLAKYILIQARLKLKKGFLKEIRHKILSYLRQRRLTQDFGFSSAGCVFKNPPGFSAGWLIEKCGLKNKHFGDAWVSSKHANFIINKGTARASQVLRLINYIKRKVKDKFGLDLEPEIKIWKK